MTKQSDIPYLQHMLEAIADIEESVDGLSKEQFLADKDVRDATIRRLEIIGEAVKNISRQLREAHKDIEWNKIAGTRDRVIHRYFSVDFDIVWQIIQADLPELRKKLQILLNDITTEP